MIHRLPIVVITWPFFGALKFVLWFVGLFACALSLVADGRRRTPALWKFWINVEETPARVTPRTRWKLWWEFAMRNPVRGMNKWFNGPSDYKQLGEDIDESQPGVQWRYRYAGLYDSFRVVWGEPRSDKGKREFYIGWKIGSSSPFRFTAQLRL